MLTVELAAIKEQRNQANRDIQKLEKTQKQLNKQLDDEKAQHMLVISWSILMLKFWKKN